MYRRITINLLIQDMKILLKKGKKYLPSDEKQLVSLNNLEYWINLLTVFNDEKCIIIKESDVSFKHKIYFKYFGSCPKCLIYKYTPYILNTVCLILIFLIIYFK